MSTRLLAETLLLAMAFIVVPPVLAQTRRQPPPPATSPSMRMQDTTITGERPTPDVFFIVPTGKGGNVRSPHRRDYAAEILEPVVKPWLEKDQNVTLAALPGGEEGFDWKSALNEPPPPPPAVEPQPVLPRAAPVEMPSQALSLPPVAPPPMPAPVERSSLPPLPPPPPLPEASQPRTTSEGVPILVPPQ